MTAPSRSRDVKMAAARSKPLAEIKKRTSFHSEMRSAHLRFKICENPFECSFVVSTSFVIISSFIVCFLTTTEKQG